jgi:3,4-dihydroxy 2-butanone 4-phosphate synthase/GTP cyclohydrolase II
VLQRHRLHHGDGTRPRVTRGATVGMPTAHGLLRATGYRDELGGVEHLALAGGPTTGVPLVGVHVECLLGEVFGSLACSCAHRLDASLQRVAAEGGVVVYVRRSRGSHVRNATTTAAAHAVKPADAAAAAAQRADRVALHDLGPDVVLDLQLREVREPAVRCDHREVRPEQHLVPWHGHMINL